MSAPLSPWVSIYDVLGTYAPAMLDEDGNITGDPAVVAQWQEQIDYAQYMLWTLTRGAVHAEECWVDEYFTKGCKIRLKHGPLLTVLSVWTVTVCGDPGDGPAEISYCLIDPMTINVCCGDHGLVSSQCGCQATVVRVYYRTDSTLPPGTPALVGWLANQFVLSMNGEKCQLPQRISSVNRQGVSWTMLDPMDFLDKGRSGIDRVDQWVTLVKMNHPSAVLIDPLRTQLRSSRRENCDGAEFESSEYDPGFSTDDDD